MGEEQAHSFSLGGLGVEVVTDEPLFMEWLKFDFDAFPSFTSPFLKLRVEKGPILLPPGLKESFRGPYGVCFDQGTVRHILYPGPVWVQFDFAREEGVVRGTDLPLVYERVYLTIMSRLGEALEKQGLHRVHALGLDSPRGAVLFLFPAGMGKSTLAVSLLQAQGWRLFSEDTPLVDPLGNLQSLPFRLGLRDDDLAEPFSPEQLSSSPYKTLVRATAFPVEYEPKRCTTLFLGAWTTGPEALIETAPRYRVLAALIRDLVVGSGIPQVTELFLQLHWRDVWLKAGLGTSRLTRAFKLASQCRCHRIYLSPDPNQNVKRLQQWAETGL